MSQQNILTMKQEQIRYEEWLTTIANTRLVYNTMEELEQFFDNLRYTVMVSSVVL